MSKVMIVEDDDSLREIYGIRLAADGYGVVSAHDGEEALAVAVKERPDLIISDVMMPKISGFDMLDILRSTPETANIKVIMMTALSSDDQRNRGESLGADRYLVKSQVGIEDVVNVVHEVLNDRNPGAVASPDNVAAMPAAEPMPNAQPAMMGNPTVMANNPAMVAPDPAMAAANPGMAPASPEVAVNTGAVPTNPEMLAQNQPPVQNTMPTQDLQPNGMPPFPATPDSTPLPEQLMPPVN